MATKKDPTTAAELGELTVGQLEKLAAKRKLTVTRADDEPGEPLKEDYVRALSAPASRGSRQSVPTSPYVDAQGHPVNEDAERIDKYGRTLETE